MAQRGNETGGRRGPGAARLLGAILAGILAASPVHAQAPAQDPAAAVLEAARQAAARGTSAEGLDDLRLLRSRYPDSPLVQASFAVGVDIALASGDAYLARYYMDRLSEIAPQGGDTFRTALSIASYYYQRRSYVEALPYYRLAVLAADGGGGIPARDLAGARLHAAELDAYHQGDEQEARRYFAGISRADLAAVDQPLYRQLRVRLLWSDITATDLGLSDSNVSSLHVDGDDLWVGTWNGGTARYSVSAAHGDPFPSPAFVRTIEVNEGRVWIGTAEGLSWYGKATGRWGQEDDFRSPDARNVQVVRASSSSLYAGTLGDGLFRLAEDGWQPVGDRELPGRFITALATDPQTGRLLVGTMNLGLIVLDPGTGAMQGLSEIDPDFTASNITTILPDQEGRVWIGTYGDGLFRWTPSTGQIAHFTKETGEIGDDWVLGSCETDRAIYFGSFGAGVSLFLKKQGTWSRFGLSEGLASLDVTAIAWRAPFVFFGTLGAGVSVYDEAADGSLP